jgi:RHS repeat-associated protein
MRAVISPDGRAYPYVGMGNANPDAVTQIATGYSTTSLVYDADGNVVQKTVDGTTTSYVYDYANRLIALGAGGATTTYGYDWTGNRVSQTGTTTTYLYPFKWYSVASSTGSGAKYATTTDYVFNGNTLLATVDQQTASGNATGTAKTRYVHPDHLGSTNVVTDENDNVVQTLDYYPYGSTRISSATSTNERRKYIGQFSDDSTLSYLNARYYSPTQGQFLGEDPALWGDPKAQLLMDPQSLNTYSYSEDNPIVREDPLGKMAIGFGLGGGGNIPGLYGDGSTFWVLTFNPLPFDVEIGTVTSGEGGGTTAILGGSGSVRIMTSKNAQSLQDFQGWGATAGVSAKIGPGLGFDYGAAKVDDPNNKKERVIDTETISFELGGVATPYVVPVEFHGGGSYSQVSNTTNLTSYVTSAANSVKSGVQSSYAYIQAQINYIQQEINVIQQQIAQLSQNSSNNSKSTK